MNLDLFSRMIEDDHCMQFAAGNGTYDYIQIPSTIKDENVKNVGDFCRN